MSVKHLTDENFKKEIEKTQKAVVDFSADWCGPCKMYSPLFEKVATEGMEGVSFFKIDVDHAEKVSTEFNVMSVPTTIFFQNGGEKDRTTGVLNEEALKKEISQKLG